MGKVAPLVVIDALAETSTFFGRLRSRICSEEGTLTSQMTPHFCRRMSVIQLRSNSHQRRPCRALDGKAWWLLCQFPPREMRESHHTFEDASADRNGREPKV